MEHAREVIHRALSSAHDAFSNRAAKISEADTRHHFLDPLISALGWHDLNSVSREYYLRASGEYIDYVMMDSGGTPVLAVEAKALGVDLTDKHAAQLVQYCSVAGIEWAALTNARRLRLFNTFLPGDFRAKQVIDLKLVGGSNSADFEEVFDQLWHLSRDEITSPQGTRRWMNQLRLDPEMRRLLSSPDASMLRSLRRKLETKGITANDRDVADWLRGQFQPHETSTLHENPTQTNGGERAIAQSRPDFAVAPHKANSRTRGRPGSNFESLLEQLKSAVAAEVPGTIWREKKHYGAASIENLTYLAVKFYRDRMIVGLTLPQIINSDRLDAEPGVFHWSTMTKALSIRVASDIDAEMCRLVRLAFEHGNSKRRAKIAASRVDNS